MKVTGPRLGRERNTMSSSGNVIFGGLGPGLGGSINPFDQDYEKKVLAQKNQQAVDTLNAKNAADYINKATQIKVVNIQGLADHQPLVTIDPPPHKWVLDALGNQVQSTDLVTPAMSVVPDPPTAGQAAPGQIVSATPATDREDMLLIKVDRLTAMLAAIAAKLGM
jgi:hypothetical protein